MKKLIWLAVIVTVGFGGKFLLEDMFVGGETHTASERVRVMLAGMQPQGDLDASIAMWSQGVSHFRGSMDEFDRAATGWENWAKQKDILKVSSFEITEAAIEEGDEDALLGQAAVLVTARVNGKTVKMRVRQGGPIEWAGT